MTNKCIFCDSEDINLVEIAENKISEVCFSCGKKIIYDRIKVAKKEKETYITSINYALKLVKQPKVMFSAAGKRRLMLLDTIYIMSYGIEVLEWKQQQAELGGLELRVIWKVIEKNDR